MNEEFEKIKQMIADSNLRLAMDLLKIRIQHIPDFETQILSLQSRFSNYKKATHTGQIDPIDKEFSAIVDSLLDLVKKAEIVENSSEETRLKNLTNTLHLIPVQSEKILIYYNRFQTGEIFEMQVSPDMNTRELKNRLIPTAMPNYLLSIDLQEQFGFELALQGTGIFSPLDDNRSLRENGVKEKNTVYLKKYFFNATR